MLVRAYIAQKRKIKVGDDGRTSKTAGWVLVLFLDTCLFTSSRRKFSRYHVEPTWGAIAWANIGQVGGRPPWYGGAPVLLHPHRGHQSLTEQVLEDLGTLLKEAGA